ncbi:MAG: hypothetical protein IJ301_03595 [Clostridia bacterium]|nr:hypothetical protein [Clostridia bacterium]
MQANLLLFYDEGNNDFVNRSVKPLICQQFSRAMLDIAWITAMPVYSKVPNIMKNLTDHSIIVVGFCEEYCFNNIKSALNTYYQTAPILTSFGLFYKIGNKTCSVVDLGQPDLSNINYDVLSTLYNSERSFCLKFFGINEFDLLKQLNNIEYINNFEFTHISHFGEIQLTFRAVNEVGEQRKKDFKRALYEVFGDYIFSDESKSLIECVNEIAEVRRQNFAVIDLISNGEIIADLNRYSALRQLKQNLSIDEIHQLLNENNGSNIILEKYNLDFIVLIVGSLSNAQILLIDGIGIHRFNYNELKDPNFNKKYIFNLILSKIFIKFRKNYLFF